MAMLEHRGGWLGSLAEVRVDGSWWVIALLITYSMYLRASVLFASCRAAARSRWASGRRCLFDRDRSWSTSWPTHSSLRARGIRSRTSPIRPVRWGHPGHGGPGSPGDEFLIVAGGTALQRPPGSTVRDRCRLYRDVPSALLAGTLGLSGLNNLLLARVNLCPRNSPLDGGRLLRGPSEGHRQAYPGVPDPRCPARAWAGCWPAGVALPAGRHLAGGIWFAFIGWFLVQAARSSYQDLQLQQLPGGGRPRT